MTTADPFAALHAELAPQSALRDAITAATRRPEAQALAPLLKQAMLDGRISAEKMQAAWVDVGTPERLTALDLQIREGMYA